MKTHYTKQQGFTLIELMIVVAIIGVLAAVAVPAYKDYVTKSEASSAIATLRALQTPAELYIQEHGKLEDVTKLGTSEKANGLGELSITSSDKSYSIIFKFTKEGALKDQTITLKRDDTNGWTCESTDKIAELDIKSCSKKSTSEPTT
ncbi:pilin [Vibrio metschnikovii]|uniref:pilin n=1 Tax=Vibrio sp. V33_P6A3T137 TaxID=1938685 RepID=UPI0013728F5D|nr:pilin [Vibrio sp. V33_P6A3T137]NAW79376.1 prepilin-type N-terminal cleavage/methylation domain-containing protein [Vibrio sp. V33_P6A3T137]